MNIVHIASELAPVAKVGGLADVVLGLAREQSAQGHAVEIILPKYDCLLQRQVHDLRIYLETLETYYDGHWYDVKVWSGWVQDVQVYFIDAYAPRSFFSRGCVYGAHDDIERFAYFSRSALQFLLKSGRQPDIIHTHDWQTGLVAPLLRELYSHKPLAAAKTVFTIHNVEFQGRCAAADLDKVGLQGLELLHSGKLSDNGNPHLVNIMKGAIVYNNFFTTVSPTYAKEVLTPQEGRGMEHTIDHFRDKFEGVINGIDYHYWNPETDPLISEHFSANQLADGDWSGKDRARMALRQRLNMAQEQRPIVSCIARLTPQKGIHLIRHALEHTQALGGQFILLGTSPRADIQAEFESIKAMNYSNPHIHLCLRSSEELAHQIFAGSDAILVPSVFEPCGLTQLIAMRYGCVPIVRRTGGLADTVFDVETSGRPEVETNGFTFDDADFSGVNWGLDRAITCWRDTPEKWRNIALRGMEQDYSWKRPSQRYLAIYQSLI